MTVLPPRATPATRAHPLELVAAAGILVALAARPVAAASAWVLVAVGLVAAIGLAEERVARGGMRARIAPVPAVVALALGLAAFGAARLLGDGFGVRYDTAGIVVVVVAAIVEEAFFRGALDARLRRAGLGALAVGALTATSFALIHVPTYGLAILPLDLAAGAVLAWQREVSGTWLVPALTHVAANLAQLG